MANIAIFDLDYTLTKRGTWGRFVFKNVQYKPWLWPVIIGRALWNQWRYKRGLIQRIDIKKDMMNLSMSGKSKSALLDMAQDFARKEVPHKFRPGAIRAIEHHQACGDSLMIASAGACIVVEAIAQKLGIEHWVATQMLWEDGRLSYQFGSDNCYGIDKLKAVRLYLDENPQLKQSDTVITFYSDSYSDIDMFRFSDISIAVNPDRALRHNAKSLGIKIVDWNR